MKKKLAVGLLVAAGVLVLFVTVAGTVFYVKIYRPIGAPLAAMSGAKALEDRRLQNRREFQPPVSGELTAEQAANFVAVEEGVQKQLAGSAAVLAQKQEDLERASKEKTLSVPTAMLVFGDIRGFYLPAKVAQIDAMNRANFSKEEFEWVRKQLYRAAGLRLSQVDVSEILVAGPNATVEVRQFEPGGSVPEQNERIARPIASKLEAWRALGFFGL